MNEALVELRAAAVHSVVSDASHLTTQQFTAISVFSVTGEFTMKKYSVPADSGG